MVDSTEVEPSTSRPNRYRQSPRSGALVFGMLLVGLGGTVATAAQTAFSVAQSASIWILVCAAVVLAFLIGRARSRP